MSPLANAAPPHMRSIPSPASGGGGAHQQASLPRADRPELSACIHILIEGCMRIDRRSVVAGLSASLLAPGTGRAATVTDSAGRAVPMPAQVARVFPAGPPAAILLYTLAP